MSRTYRRKNKILPEWAKTRFEKINGSWVEVTLSDKKAKAIFHKDKSFYFKEPGPSWFKNMFMRRPARRKDKIEIKKEVTIEDYEGNYSLNRKPKIYWT